MSRLKLPINTRFAACHPRHSAAVCAAQRHLTDKTQCKVVETLSKKVPPGANMIENHCVFSTEVQRARIALELQEGDTHQPM